MEYFTKIIVNNSSIDAIKDLCSASLNDYLEFNLVATHKLNVADIENLNTFLATKKQHSGLLIPVHLIDCISYNLVRVLQDKKWRIIVCDKIDNLIDTLKKSDRTAIKLLERKIELANKFRVDIDYYLTFPEKSYNQTDAELIFNHFTSNKVRSVSFYYQNLLSEIVPYYSNTNLNTNNTVFFQKIFELWKDKKEELLIDDVRRSYDDLLSHFNLETKKHTRLFYLKNNKVFELIESEKIEAASAPKEKELLKSLALCENSCEYYAVCGGDLFSNKYFFNKTICSSKNRYCEDIKIPYLQYLIEEFTNN
jgi:hypothetical protein